MPRASGSGKRQSGNAAGHRDSRHDNGLVSPAKRNSAKKHHGQFDGSARSADQHPGHAGPSSSSSSLVPQREPNGLLVKGNSDATIDNRCGDAIRRGSLGTCSETSSDSSQSQVGTVGAVEGGHRQIDVNALKNVDVHKDSSLLEVAVTVVKSLPIQDTLAILILLMQVPYMFLSVIYAAFALLTFVPPVVGKTGMSVSLAEILDGGSHTPSLITVACMDVFFFLIWVFLWRPIQDGILEFAKPVVAITLGGGTNAKDGTSRGVATCFTWILVHQVIRATRSHWARFVQHLPNNWPIRSILGDPLEPKFLTYDKRSSHAWIQSTLAMHILTQGIVRYVREWYLKREKSSSTSSLGEAEAGKTPFTGSSSVSGLTGGGNASHSTDAIHDNGMSTTDAEAGVFQPSATTSTITTTKQRKKQSAQVRLQQPLWAALASTKIVAAKELELSSFSASNVDGTKAQGIHNVGSAPFDTQLGQIWISYVGSDEVCFSTSHFLLPDNETVHAPKETNGQVASLSEADMPKPFYVRINDAFWQPTRFYLTQEPQGNECKGTRWTGDIYGLRPASKYVCEFVDSQTDKVIFSACIRTVKETLREDGPTSPAFPPSQQPLRPDSPATTLRTSIAAADIRLADERSRLKTWRRDWKAKINAVKKENETVDNQLLSAGNNDDKHRQKVRQNETTKSQADRDIESVTDQLKNFDSAPGLAELKKKADKAFTTEKKVYDAAKKDFEEYKSTLDRDVKDKETERSNLTKQRMKLMARINKLDGEIASMTDANNRGLDEVQRRRQERNNWLGHVAGVDGNYADRIRDIRNANIAKVELIRNQEIQLQGFHAVVNSANGLSMDVGGGLTGEPTHASFQQQAAAWNHNPTMHAQYPTDLWAGSSSELIQPIAALSAPSNAATWQPPPTAPPFEPRGAKSRGRSSSMLSNVSGFTEPSDEETFMSPMTGMPQADAGNSGGHGASRNSSSTGSGSIGDPASPR